MRVCVCMHAWTQCWRKKPHYLGHKGNIEDIASHLLFHMLFKGVPKHLFSFFQTFKSTECEGEMYHFNFSKGICIIGVNSKKIAPECTQGFSSLAIPVGLQIALRDVCNTQPMRHTMCCSLYFFVLLHKLAGDCQFRLAPCCVCFAHFLCCFAGRI